MKTYSKPNRSIVNNSLDPRKILFNGMIKKKNKKKIQIKDLPVRAVGETFLQQDSFHVSTEDTFDKLIKGKVYNAVNIKSHISIVNNSDSDMSQSIRRVNKFYSPIMTRSRKKSASITEVSSSSNIVKHNKTDDLQKTENYIYSPIMTRSRKKTICRMNTTDVSINANRDNRNDSVIPHFKEPTVEKIDFSLEVEKVRNPVVKSLSYIVIPEVKEGENSVGTMTNHVNAPKADPSFESIFTKTFREKQFIHSSTPLNPKATKQIINYTISPIKNVSGSEDLMGIERHNFMSKNSYTPLKHIGHTNINYISEIETPSLVSNVGNATSEKFQSEVESQQFKKSVSDKENLNFACNSVQPQLSSSNMSRESFITLRRRKILKPITLPGRKQLKDFKGYRKPFCKDDVRCEQKSSRVEDDSSIQLEQGDSKNRLKLSSKLTSMEDFSGYFEKMTNENAAHGFHKQNDFETFDIQNEDISNSKDLRDSSCEPEGSQKHVSQFINKRGRMSSDSCLIIDKKQKTGNEEKSFRLLSFQENSVSVYPEVPPQDMVHLPKMNFVFGNTFTNSVSTDGSRTSFDRSNSRQSIRNSSNTDTSTNGSSELSDSDFFRLKRPVLKDIVVNVTKMSFSVPPSTESLLDNSKSLFESDSTDFNNESPNDYSISIASQTSEDPPSNVIEKFDVIEQADVLNLERGQIAAWQKQGAASIISNAVSNNNLVNELDNNQREKVCSVSIDDCNKFFENVTKKSRCTRISRQRSTNDKLSQVSTPSFHNDLVSGELANRVLVVNLRKSPWGRKGKEGALSSGSNAESRVIDPTDSIEEGNRKSHAIKDVSKPMNKNSNISDIIESSVLESSQVDRDGFKIPVMCDARKRQSKTLMLKAGKLWRRSFAMFRRSSMVYTALNEDVCRLANETFCVCSKCNLVRHGPPISNRRDSIRIVPVEPISDTHREISVLENYAYKASYVSDRILEENLENDLRSLSLSKRKDSIVQDSAPLTARELVLKKCGQEEPLPFEECYSESLLQNCQKIGEGLYGEVFLFRNPNGGTSVMKIIPIEGDQIVNGERQKKFEEILSEITIALELSNLRNNKHNKTNGFSEVQKVCCVQGRYPEKLVDLWDLYDETRGSENDSPEIFGEDQLYIILQLANGGRDLEAFIFNNALQAYTMFQQVACTLAVAEEELHFEHRDLHWGNVLLSAADRNTTVTFRLNGKNFDIATRGVEVAIIDFTLSRIECEGVVIFNDLSLDPDLFTADGDYQFEVYKLMQKKNANNWQRFEPYTNVLWLHYTLDKAVTALRYKNAQSKVHKEYLSKLRQLRDEMLKYGSAKEFVLENF